MTIGRSIGIYAIITFGLTAGGQLLGLLREISFGSVFGTSREFDVYTAVFTVVLSVGAFLSVMPSLAVPELVRLRDKSDGAAVSAHVNSLLLLALGLTIPLVTLAEIWPDGVILIVGAGFAVDHGPVHALAVSLVRLALPLSILMALVHVARGLLYATRQFALPAVESLFYNISIIAFVFVGWAAFESKDVRLPIIGCYVAYGLYLAVLYKKIFSEFQPSRTVKWGDVLKTLKAGTCLFVATLLSCASPIIILWHASFADEGTVSVLGYAQRLTLISVTAIVNSVMAVFLPSASLMIAREHRAQISAQTQTVVRVFVVVAMAAALVLLLQGDFLVRMLYHDARFDLTSVERMTEALLGYVPWLFFFPLSAIASRLFFASRSYGTVLLISLSSIFVTLIFINILPDLLGTVGFTLVASLHMATYASLLMAVVMRRHIDINVPLMLASTLQPIILFAGVLAVARWASHGLEWGSFASALADFIGLGLAMLIALNWIVPFKRLFSSSKVCQEA